MKTSLRKIFEDADNALKNGKELKKDYPDYEGLSSLFNIYDVFWDDTDNIKCYFLQSHLCTDTIVGLKLYYLKDEMICYSYQSARKSREHFKFFSEEKAIKLRDYLLSLLKNEDDELDVYYLNDDELDAPLDDLYKIDYSNAVLHKYAIYLGESRQRVVKILDKASYSYNTDKFADKFHDVEVEFLDDKSKRIVNVDDLGFRYNQGYDDIPTVEKKK